jgi:hypothetical protein
MLLRIDFLACCRSKGDRFDLSWATANVSAAAVKAAERARRRMGAWFLVAMGFWF